jgi:ABC-type bacteriocin/lantibiotic exporter with double-glycine peptidase domain
MRMRLAVVAVALACCKSEPPPGPAPVQAILDSDPSHQGAAALAMTLAAFGQPARVDELLADVNEKDYTANGLGIIRAAKARGLEGALIEVSRPMLTDLRAGDIVQFRRKSFAVVERIDPRGVHIIEPTSGARTIPFELWDVELRKVAFVFQRPGETRFADLNAGRTSAVPSTDSERDRF